jgi:16S rRNA (cytosine1402-N4)-methyltransferase
MADYIEDLGLVGKINGVLLDLGVSSPQLDDADRGFSFLRDGPLDMRMDNSQGETAAQWIARAEIEDMAWVFKTYGEEKNSRHIARCIAADRDEKPFLRTKDLAELIARITKNKERNKHPATRVFQAIRIYINSELEQIDQALEGSLKVLAPEGRLSVISFHSLEDRMVKRFIRRHSQGESVPYGLPITEDQINKSRKLKPMSKALKPSDEEIEQNPRSRSSVLRVAERLPY